MKTNPLVNFLGAYGPQASANNLFDEFVRAAAEKYGCEPLHVEQPLIAELVEMFESSSPKSVILTGTAGDGKTYTARKVAETLTGSEDGWSNTDKEYELPTRLPSGHRLRVIKDLSELTEENKTTLFPEIVRALTGKGDTLFVICVNDGHLLKFFRDRDAPELRDLIARMLRDDVREDPEGCFHLINMSRQSHQRVIDQVIDAMVEHVKWADCEGCPALVNKQQRCPIQCNRDILRERHAASMRARLKDMIRMAAADGRHLSIRQLLLLTANILLGDAEPGASLMDCQLAQQRAKNNGYESTNPYANAFGHNLTERERRQYGAFMVLSEFQVGFETSNTFDHGLLWGDESFPSCDWYGDRIFADIRDRYRGDPVYYAVDFQEGMIQQRRRLFFSMAPPHHESQNGLHRSPWNLSLFKHAAYYVAIVDGLLTNRMPGQIARRILRGLNRMMTGEMTLTEDRLWVTVPSGVYMGSEVPLLVTHAGQRSHGNTTTVTFGLPGIVSDNGRPPELLVETHGHKRDPVRLALRPTLVECLLRIADGALPASFSAETQREVERFQLQVATAVRDSLDGISPVPKEVLMRDGHLQEQVIAVIGDGNGAWQ
jgi:hypothetical protein